MPKAMRGSQLVIGLTGSFGSGCSEVAEILAATGDFHAEPLSKAIKDEAKKQSLDQKRPLLQDLGNELRMRHGADFLAKRAIAAARKAAPRKHFVFDGIRNLGEVAALRSQFPSFYLVAVDASRETRWQRLKDDPYAGDMAAFIRDDDRDRLEPYPYGQQVALCVDAADVLLLNEEDTHRSRRRKEFFQHKVRTYTELMSAAGSRAPSPRELLMHLAYSASLRSSCLKRQVGAAIAASYPITEAHTGDRVEEATEYTVIAIGYNEVPFGQEPCRDEYGTCYRDLKRQQELDALHHLRCECGQPIAGRSRCDKCQRDWAVLYSETKGLEYCRSLHAEETAILQGTRTGGPQLRDTVLYSTTFPCLLCAKDIVHAGIREVVYVEAYPSPEAREFLADANVTVTRFEGVKAQAFYKLFKAAPA